MASISSYDPEGPEWTSRSNWKSYVGPGEDFLCPTQGPYSLEGVLLAPASNGGFLIAQKGSHSTIYWKSTYLHSSLLPKPLTIRVIPRSTTVSSSRNICICLFPCSLKFLLASPVLFSRLRSNQAELFTSSSSQYPLFRPNPAFPEPLAALEWELTTCEPVGSKRACVSEVQRPQAARPAPAPVPVPAPAPVPVQVSVQVSVPVSAMVRSGWSNRNEDRTGRRTGEAGCGMPQVRCGGRYWFYPVVPGDGDKHGDGVFFFGHPTGSCEVPYSIPYLCWALFGGGGGHCAPMQVLPPDVEEKWQTMKCSKAPLRFFDFFFGGGGGGEERAEAKMKSMGARHWRTVNEVKTIGTSPLTQKKERGISL